ncbi:polyamine deacetylase HDAC10 isoform X3 [Dromiciops gliroides]|uniref:polyamine deacetylase HDAC10 isoform X3 n=1 Tax=Dromiciops gliroides TaxID=33562 RepID=UPI001CC53348|nr:polyamine deacetylase HDAC10 isoform X3 [Dromiciops gliroides]
MRGGWEAGRTRRLRSSTARAGIRMAENRPPRPQGTALIYDKDMTRVRLLWDDPECGIEVPERLTSTYARLSHRGLVQRCVRLPAREATEEELELVHSPEYVAVVKGTQTMSKEELQTLAQQYDAVYFHPSTFPCARMAVGATLQLVDAVLTGAVGNGMALVRPPGHHSQRDAANGFCVFNNVAIAAEHAKRRHGLQRILIVDWDIHHGQGTQRVFESDPSVLYFSWHRYEHQSFWPRLRESDYDAVGQGPGRGFTVNVPWNKVGMRNADYVSVFLHVLLPLAIEFDPELVLVSAGFDSGIGDPEGQMKATPECFAHLTLLLLPLARGRLCAVLEGGYHLQSLAECVCLTLQTLLGDPVPPLSGDPTPCLSALESIQNVRAAHVPHWASLRHEETGPVLTPSTQRGDTGASLLGAQSLGTTDRVGSLLDKLLSCPISLPYPDIGLAVPDSAASFNLPPALLQEKDVALSKEEAATWARLDSAFTEDQAFADLGKLLALLDKILTGQIRAGIAVSPSVSAALAVALRRGLSLGAQSRLLCVAIGDLDVPEDLRDNGQILLLNIGGKETAPTPTCICLAGHEATEPGAFLLALTSLILPVAYNFQPELVLVVLGPGCSLRSLDVELLTRLLQGPAAGRMLLLLQNSELPLVEALAWALAGRALPSALGPFFSASPKQALAVTHLCRQLQLDWPMLQVSVT